MAIPQAITATARGTARAVKALLAAAITIGVLVGIPWALLHYAGSPVPHAIPHLDAVRHSLDSTMTPQVLLKCLSVVGWYLWLVLAVSFAVELVAAGRRVNAPHIPTLGPTQALAAALITAIGITALLRAAPAQAAETTITPTGARVAATAPAVAGTTSLTAAHAALGVAAPGTAPRETVHTVEPGDSLSSIAQEDLGNGSDWPQLYKLNVGVVQADGETLTDPDLIRPGWTIRIAAPVNDPTPGTAGNSATPPNESAPVSPETAPSVASTPTNTAAPPSSSTHTAPDAPHTASPAAHAAPQTGERHQVDKAARRHGGVSVSLPDGGAIGISLAVALGAALVLARRWRTRLADPRLPVAEQPLPGALLAARRAQLALSAAARDDEQSEDDGEEGYDDLYGPPDFEEREDASLDAATYGNPDDGDGHGAPDLGSQEPDEDELDAFGAPTGPALAPRVTQFAEPLPPGSISAAERDGVEIPLAPTGTGLGLVGPGAAGAARAIAAAVLSAGAPDRTGDLARLIIPAADLAALLGVETEQLAALTAGVPELVVTPDLATALSEAEVNALLRTRLLEETGTADLDEMATQHPDEEDCPPLVLMASPERFATGRIAALIDDSAHLRITAVLLGSHPRSATAFVESNGYATGPGLDAWTGTRLFDLSAESLTVVLRVLAQAAGHVVEPEQTPPSPARLMTVETEPESAPEPEADEASGAAGAAAARPEAGDGGEGGYGVEGPSPGIPAGTTLGVKEVSEAAAAPRLVLIADPAEQLAEAHLEAWATRPVRISVLGPLRIEASGGPVTKLRSQARPIVALLAWKAGAGLTDEQIDQACWPDEDDLERVRRWRQDGLKSLRSRLREVTGRKTPQFVPLRDRRDYLLDPEFAAVDLWVFRALDRAAGAVRDEQARLRYLTEAVQFCAGEFLVEEASDDFAWADAPRITIKAEQVSVLTRYAELAAENEQHDPALAALRQAAALADDNEFIYRRMFELLAVLGRRAEIAAQMEVLDANADAMGASVSPATRELAARLLRPRNPVGPAASNAPLTMSRPTNGRASTFATRDADSRRG